MIVTPLIDEVMTLCDETSVRRPASTRPTRHLFIDDAGIEKCGGRLRRTLHQPAKRGAVLKPGRPCVIQIRSAPMWIPDQRAYALVYMASDPSSPCSGRYFATSEDGVSWQLPDLARPPGPLLGQRNEVLVQTADPRWRGMDNVVLDPDDPDPVRRFKALLGAEGRLPGVSANGYDYQPLSAASPIPSSDESNLSYDAANRRFLATVKHGNQWGRAVFLSISDDFVNWTDPEFIFGADEQDQRLARDRIKRRIAEPNGGGPMFVDPEPATGVLPQGSDARVTWACDVYNMAVFSYHGLYLGLPSMFYRTGLEPPGNNTDGFHEIQLVCSRDLRTWERIGDRQPFIPPSRTDDALLGIFDRNGLLAAGPIERGEELWFYYTGIKFRTSPYEYKRDWSRRPVEDLDPIERADYEEGTGAVCLAVLRKDGFISLDADAAGGFVETKPLRVHGPTLFVNCAAADGEMTASVIDEAGTTIDSLPIRIDSTRAEVRWKNARNLRSLVGQMVRLRFDLKNASLYSFWTEQGEPS